jgi:hypothetical protein
VARQVPEVHLHLAPAHRYGLHTEVHTNGGDVPLHKLQPGRWCGWWGATHPQRKAGSTLVGTRRDTQKRGNERWPQAGDGWGGCTGVWVQCRGGGGRQRKRGPCAARQRGDHRTFPSQKRFMRQLLPVSELPMEMTLMRSGGGPPSLPPGTGLLDTPAPRPAPPRAALADDEVDAELMCLLDWVEPSNACGLRCADAAEAAGPAAQWRLLQPGC